MDNFVIYQNKWLIKQRLGESFGKDPYVVIPGEFSNRSVSNDPKVVALVGKRCIDDLKERADD